MCPYDKTLLAETVIPTDWRPKRLPGISSKTKNLLEELVTEILKEGSPFDDPLPEITVDKSTFCFTGDFTFGTRSQCQEAVATLGGKFTKGVTRSTDILVIANDGNPRWSHGSYGNKIADAMMFRLQYKKPSIISELYWRELLNS